MEVIYKKKKTKKTLLPTSKIMDTIPLKWVKYRFDMHGYHFVSAEYNQFRANSILYINTFLGIFGHCEAKLVFSSSPVRY